MGQMDYGLYELVYMNICIMYRVKSGLSFRMILCIACICSATVVTHYLKTGMNLNQRQMSSVRVAPKLHAVGAEPTTATTRA